MHKVYRNILEAKYRTVSAMMIAKHDISYIICHILVGISLLLYSGLHCSDNRDSVGLMRIRLGSYAHENQLILKPWKCPRSSALSELNARVQG